MKEDFVIIAEERCANWDKPSGRCFGISKEVLRGEPGRVTPLDHCKLIDGEPCLYFSTVVLPGIPKEKPLIPLWERKKRQKRAKSATQPLSFQGENLTKSEDPSPSIKKPSRATLYRKSKDLRKGVKMALRRARTNCKAISDGPHQGQEGA